MRFSTAIELQHPVRTAAPTHLLRRALGRPHVASKLPATPLMDSAPLPLLANEASADLDQRVRQSGEW